MCSWGCELTSPCLRLCVCVDTTHSHTHLYTYTPIYTHTYTRNRFIYESPTTPRPPLFPPFRDLLLFSLFIQCLLDGWITFRGNLFSPDYPHLHFTLFPSAASIVPLITLPRTYCRFCFRLLPLPPGRTPQKSEKERAVDGEMN